LRVLPADAGHPVRRALRRLQRLGEPPVPRQHQPQRPPGGCGLRRAVHRGHGARRAAGFRIQAAVPVLRLTLRSRSLDVARVIECAPSTLRGEQSMATKKSAKKAAKKTAKKTAKKATRKATKKAAPRKSAAKKA